MSHATASASVWSRCVFIIASKSASGHLSLALETNAAISWPFAVSLRLRGSERRAVAGIRRSEQLARDEDVLPQEPMSAVPAASP